MYEKNFIAGAIERSAETAVDRRRMLTIFGLAGAGAAAATIAGGSAAFADDSATTGTTTASAPSDATVLNFALNLEYLEAEFYLRAVYGHGLDDAHTTGVGTHGSVKGGHKVPFRSRVLRQLATEIAKDEREHVLYLRSGLSKAAVARPEISLTAAFNAAGRAAGVADRHGRFDPFANDTNFLLGAFLFEDVGVTAYKGAAQFLADAPTTYLEAAAGILAVEAYHAGIIRTSLLGAAEVHPAIFDVVRKLSNARDSLDGSGSDDQGIGSKADPNLVPTDKNSIAFGRTPGQVLNIVYLNPKPVTSGGFYPKGVNGDLNTSADSAAVATK